MTFICCQYYDVSLQIFKCLVGVFDPKKSLKVLKFTFENLRPLMVHEMWKPPGKLGEKSWSLSGSVVVVIQGWRNEKVQPMSTVHWAGFLFYWLTWGGASTNTSTKGATGWPRLTVTPEVVLVFVCCLWRECLGEAHEPASCENWNNWHQKIAEVKPEQRQ